MESFVTGLKEAGILEELSEVLPKQDIVSFLRAEWKPVAKRMLHSSHLTRSQYDNVRSSLTVGKALVLPAYSTIQRHWRKQEFVDSHQADLMSLLTSGKRVLLSLTDGRPRISIGNRLQWILFLLAPMIRSLGLIEVQSVAVLEIPLFLWYDGAPISKRRQGLFSAIKVSDLRLKNTEGQLLPLPRWLVKKVCGRSWT
jgi:hypothetical protein